MSRHRQWRKTMLEISVSGSGVLRLEHLVLDFNGTLACDGELIPGVKERLEDLSGSVCLHVVTADTFGRAAEQLVAIPCTVAVLGGGREDMEKLNYLQRLDGSCSACLGNGRNDVLMLKNAALGIAVVGKEGAAVEAILAAHVVSLSVLDALDLLLRPLRLKATLRC
jgi:soluble P-type ATPase